MQRIDAKIHVLLRRQAEAEHGRRHQPLTPDWVVEVGIGTGRPPIQLHAGDCYMLGSRRRPVDRDEARRLLADGLRARTHCRPNNGLGVLDLSRPTLLRAPRTSVPSRPISSPLGAVW
ncbi:DUF6233 domain-containing protein [Streptomyces sp. NPDC001102]